MARDDQSIGWQQHVIVCGLGHVGERVYSLLASLGEQVVIVNDVTPLFWQEMEAGQNSKLVLGDARNERILRQAGIGSARAILIVTGNDMTNGRSP
jgi:Trk K+ transport system NAD-binding subunit